MGVPRCRCIKVRKAEFQPLLVLSGASIFTPPRLLTQRNVCVCARTGTPMSETPAYASMCVPGVFVIESVHLCVHEHLSRVSMGYDSH